MVLYGPLFLGTLHLEVVREPPMAKDHINDRSDGREPLEEMCFDLTLAIVTATISAAPMGRDVDSLHHMLDLELGQ